MCMWQHFICPARLSTQTKKVLIFVQTAFCLSAVCVGEVVCVGTVCVPKLEDIAYCVLGFGVVLKAAFGVSS